MRYTRHAVGSAGEGSPTVLIGHGIGGSQEQWAPIVRGLSQDCHVVTFPVAGSKGADPGLFSPARHGTLPGYADDIRLLVDDLDLRGCVFVGHSMSAMAGALATVGDPGLFSRLVMINGSACYYNDPDDGYLGGFSAAEVDAMLHAMEVEYVAWSAGFGRHVTANEDRPELGTEFAESLMGLQPDMAIAAFRAALTGDYRRYLKRIEVPVLVLQSSHDPAVTEESARWMANNIPRSAFLLLQSTGHHPHLSDPGELLSAMHDFVLHGP